jgi:tetratricopeptide (TPR) repeat protein
VETIRQLDPAHPLIYVHQSGIYFHARNYAALENAGRDAIAANPTGWDGHYFLAVAHEGQGSHREAIPEYQSAVELSNGDLDPMAGLVHAYAASGDRKEAASRYQAVQQHSKSGYVSPYMMAVMELSLGNKESAMKLLEASYHERSPDIHYFIRSDLRLDPLRSDPRFQDLLSRTNPPD